MAGNTVHIDDSNFETEVLQSDQVVLVDIGAEWCGPCQMLAPIIDQLADEYAGRAKIAKIDFDRARQTVTAYDVMAVPTVLIFKGGELRGRVMGLRPKTEFKRMLDELIGVAA